MPAPVGQQTPEFEPPPPAVKVGIGARIGFQFQHDSDPEGLDDQTLDTAEGEFRFSGRVHELVGFSANLIGSGKPSQTGSGGLAFEAHVLDLIAEFDFTDPFHIWVGNMVVPFDRSNLSGPWGLITWNYPHTNAGVPPLYVSGPFGRDLGATVWGDIEKGMFKYHASVLHLDNPTDRPVFNGRLTLNLLDGEPGYYNASTYYGDKNIFAIGVGAQYQRDGSVTADAVEDHVAFTGDLLAEYKLPGAGTLTGEAAYYHTAGVSDADAFYVLGSFLIEQPVGIGQIQPVVRFQSAMPEPDDSESSAVDAFLNYVISKSALRLSAGFQHVELPGDAAANRVQIGVQVQQ